MKPLLLVAVSLFSLSVSVSGQSCTILATEAFKIKLAQTVSSASARESDYVEFVTLEDIYSVGTEECKTQVLIPKGTSVFGVVTRRKHRHFPFVGGKLEVKLEDLKVWDGRRIHISIARHPSMGNDPPKPCKDAASNCLAGRRNATVAPIVPATATTGSAIVAAVARSSTTRVLAATALFSLTAQGGIGDLLNGTDAQLTKDEVFDMQIAPGSAMTPPPKKP